MQRTRTWFLGLLSLSLWAALVAPAAAGNNDHFANRRRLQELERQQQQNQPALRPWGGPTTGKNWWTPTTGQQHILSRHGHSGHLGGHRIVRIPAHWERFAGRWVFVPARYQVIPCHGPLIPSGPQHIHIERHIQR